VQLSRRLANNPLGVTAMVANLVIAMWLFGQKEPVSQEYLSWLDGRDENPGGGTSGISFSLVRTTSTQLIAGRPFHALYESRPMRLLGTVNLPGFALGVLIGDFLYVPGTLVFGALVGSWMKAFAIVAMCSVQWWFAGSLVTRLWRRVVSKLTLS
jgi:hypothetical protein